MCIYMYDCLTVFTGFIRSKIKKYIHTYIKKRKHAIIVPKLKIGLYFIQTKDQGKYKCSIYLSLQLLNHPMEGLKSPQLKAFVNSRAFSKRIWPLIDMLLQRIVVNYFIKASLIFLYVLTLLFVISVMNFEKFGRFFPCFFSK